MDDHEMAIRAKTFRLEDAVIQRLNNAIAACSGYPDYVRQDEFAEKWLLRGVQELEKRRNGGKPFPDAPSLGRGRKPTRAKADDT